MTVPPDLSVGDFAPVAGEVPERLALPAPGEVHVWVVPLEAAPERVEAARRLLDAEERRRADRFRFDRHRRRFTVGRGALRRLLGAYLGRPAGSLAFGYGEKGKPYLIEPAVEDFEPQAGSQAGALSGPPDGSPAEAPSRSLAGPPDGSPAEAPSRRPDGRAAGSAAGPAAERPFGPSFPPTVRSTGAGAASGPAAASGPGAASGPAADPASGLAGPALGFNLSNSHELALVALAAGVEVGVDVEHLRPMPDALAISERFFSAAERRALAAEPEAGREAAFFRCWTRKEAYLKAVGDGLTVPLDRFDVTLAAAEPARFLALDGDPARAARWSLFHFEPAAGYVGALALPRPGRWRLRGRRLTG